MDIQRLKSAWARGARIQIRDDEFTEGAWLEAPGFSAGDFEYRIHPDDEHLQYGPVSTAFRDMALFTDSADMPEIVELFMDLAGSNWVFESTGTAIESDFCRLFYAEWFADEGL